MPVSGELIPTLKFAVKQDTVLKVRTNRRPPHIPSALKCFILLFLPLKMMQALLLTQNILMHSLSQISQSRCLRVSLCRKHY